jgi:AcrR family transcriptional regulator
MTAMTRREQQQQALRRDVLDAALAQLDDGGPTAVNWRALARAVGVSPSTLYTYFESLDALYTALILDVFDQMATEVARTVDAGAPPADRIWAAATGYRRFATTFPSRFALVFTDVLPGYAAPAGGPTIDAQVTVMAPLLAAVAAMLGRTDTDVEAWTPEQRARTVGAWSQLHGFVSLEVNHHLVWIDDLDAVFASMIEGMLAGVATA